MRGLGKNERILLEQIREKPAIFNIGRCPVEAISIGLSLSSKGLAWIDGSHIGITDVGKKALERKQPTRKRAEP